MWIGVSYVLFFQASDESAQRSIPINYKQDRVMIHGKIELLTKKSIDKSIRMSFPISST
jgi:hypothetical protein